MRFITGVLYDNRKRILFSSEEGSFRFCFMYNDILPHSSMYSFEIKGNNKLAFGQTHDHRQIAIYTGKDSLIQSNGDGFCTSAYYLSKTSCTKKVFATFDAIAFRGGSLCKVFRPKSINLYTTEDRDNNIGKFEDDSMDFKANLEGIGEISVSIHSVIQRRWGIEGSSLSNSEIELMISFPSPQPLYSAVEHYSAIKRLLSFLTYRQNVGFERIVLLKRENYEGVEHLSDYAELYISQEQSLTNKKYFNCITIEKLGSYFPILLEMFYTKPPKKRSKIISPSIGFIPENDIEYYTISNTRIKEICSAIEIEIQCSDGIMTEENDQLIKLQEQVKHTLREFCKNDTVLSSDTYNSIRSSIGYWSMPLREKMFSICNKYSDELQAAIDSLFVCEYHLDKEKVKRFVQYRNAITHNGEQQIEQDVGMTASILPAVVYCSILDRIGLPRVLIKKICGHGMLR